MATLVLGTVGRIFGGPLGGIIGTALGGVVDRSLFGGGGKPREVGRIGNIAVQSAAYGEPIPFVAGRMRAAGNLLWTSGITETATRSGGGKRSGPATTSYSYSASFAVGLAGREILGIGRIWADGKLIRGVDGMFLSPVVMRLHKGSETQAVDPLIAAAEGPGGAPAYRGIAYVVFEALPLADYGNRIPNLSFEIIADGDEAGDVGQAIAAMATAGGRPVLAIEGVFPIIAGHFSGRSGSIAEAVGPLLEMSGAVIESGSTLIVKGAGGAPEVVPNDDCQARAPGDGRSHERRKRAGGEALVGAVEIAYYDTSRDFQPGLQRVRRDAVSVTDHQSIACAMSPLQAKSLAAAMLARSHAARLRMTVRLPWRHLTLRPGALVRFAEDAIIWRVREARFEAFIVYLELERVEAAPVGVFDGDGGRALTFDDRSVGATTVELLDLPLLPGEVVAVPRLLVAAAGVSPAWRRAGIEVSGDGGESYAPVGMIEGGVALGNALNVLGGGRTDCWDRFASVDVELVSDSMWLEGRSASSVIAGSNLALLGDEIIQFAEAEALGPRRFRLSRLLRGRRGTEAAATEHGPDERFVMLDPASMLTVEPPADALGRQYRVRATGSGDVNALPVSAIASGRALLPLSPAHLRLNVVDGAVVARWLRRSRTGFGWVDFVDAPLGEAVEAYRVEVRLGNVLVRTVVVDTPAYVYSAQARQFDGGGSSVTITVAQLSAAIGPGTRTAKTLILQ